MDKTHEDRITYLELVLDAQIKLNTILFKLLIQKDRQVQMEIAEVLRQMMVSPAVSISPELQTLARSMRELLVLSIPQEVVEAARKPSIRPAE